MNLSDLLTEVEDLRLLDDYDLARLLDDLKGKLARIKAFQKYNRIEYFKPFDYQRKFMAAGKSHNIRYLRAGNRCGKTYGAASEFAMHLTGRYPDWWEGRVVPNGGHTYWAVGVTLDSVRRVLQKELLGTENAKVTDEIGTGTIPRDAIDFESISRDGNLVKSVCITHKDGSINTLNFYGSQNEAVMMGQKVIGVMFDEEPEHRSLEIYSQIKTRLLNAGGDGVDGFLIFTATPEQGNTPLNEMFDSDETGVLYLQTASIYDNPTLTPEQIEKHIAQIPEYQREMRIKGIPIFGTGAVFTITDELIRFDSVQPLAHWQVISAVDWGNVKDPTVWVVAIKDPDANKYYLLEEYYFDKSEEERTAHHLAKFILDSEYCAVPVVIPHDSGLDSDANETNGKILQRYGVNTSSALIFRNPTDSQLQIKKYSNNNKSVRQISTGLEEMRLMFNQDQLKIKDTCYYWFKEKRSYFWKHNPVTGAIKPSGADHVIDASRYAIMSLLDNKGCNWSDRRNMNLCQFNSFDSIQFNQF